MFHCVLYQPEIPPNTGNIIRLCANTQVQLHLIHPLGFQLTDKKLRRAGLDYHDWATIQEHVSFSAFMETFQPPLSSSLPKRGLEGSNPQRIFACSTKGQTCYSTPRYQQDDVFLFGPETRGLPPEILSQFSAQQIIRIPMRAGNRSLNLSNAVAVIIYEAWRQLGFQ